MLAAVSLLSATAGPKIQEYVELAQMTKARGDLRVIGVSLIRLENDVGAIRATHGRQTERPTLLVTEGEIPAVEGQNEMDWTLAVDGPRVQALSDHLVDNGANYPQGSEGSRWRGPYIERLSADPWGSRYAVNAQFLSGRAGVITVVLSAGPDKKIETPFRLEKLLIGGDDLIALISSGH